MIILIIPKILDALGPSAGAGGHTRLGGIRRASAGRETESVIALQERTGIRPAVGIDSVHRGRQDRGTWNVVQLLPVDAKGRWQNRRFFVGIGVVAVERTQSVGTFVADIGHGAREG